MLRWLFVLLLIANLLYAGWNWQQQRSAIIADARQTSAPTPTLMLVEELGAPPPATVAAESPDKGADREAEPEQLAQQCWFAGDYANKAAADRAVGVIQGMQLEAKLVAREVPDEADYWVHVGPFGSRDEAIRALQQLRGRNIDSFLIDEGELKNAISLGFFSQKSSAQRLLRRYRDLEYSLQVHEVLRYKTHYDLFAYGRVEGVDIEQALAREGLTAKSSKREKKSCN